jgi:S-DNA-T family DNA segregation ATPase FtsK/SpoIIIE
VNALICSLVMRAKPDEVKFILIDPKRVELAQYRGLPHLLTEVIVEPDKAVNALKWTVGTMESRYHEFALRGVRNIAGYNAALRSDEPRMPYIVVVIDELADLMMMSAYEVEATITRIAQLARATGIHLVVATQRPSVQVVTGLIKANIPSRIAFAMTSGTDSRTILDAGGAEDLLGRGDMLYLPIDAPRAVRLQGVLVTDPEIEALARFWKGQGAPRYRTEVTAPRRDSRAGEDGEGDGDADPLLRQAVDIVRRSDKAPPRSSSAGCGSATRGRRGSSTRWRIAASSAPPTGAASARSSLRPTAGAGRSVRVRMTNDRCRPLAGAHAPSGPRGQALGHRPG